MNDRFDHVTPEQKLIILRAEIITPLAIIQGCAIVIKKHFETENSESKNIMDCIEEMATSADKIRKILDELDRGK